MVVSQTALILQECISNCAVKHDTRLRERNLGCLHGKLLEELGSDDEGYAELISGDANAAIPQGGESTAMLDERAKDLVHDLGRTHSGALY